MSQLPDAELFDRYLAGECTEEEALLVQRYLAEHPEDDELVAYFRDLIEEEAGASTQSEARASLAALHQRMHKRPAPIVRMRVAPAAMRLTNRRSTTALLAAAASIVLAFVGWSLLQHRGKPAATLRDVATPTAVAMRQFVTENGQRSTIQLPDGSEILLNVGTRVSIPEDYGKVRRAIYLDGEARFAVHHDSKVPFLVFARGTVTEDVGTVFVVRAYAEDRRSRVAVIGGKVTLSADSIARENLPMSEGDVGTVLNGKTTVRRGEMSELTDWMSGRLAFRNTPVKEALAELNRWYALDFELEDPSINSKVLNATFEGQAITQDVIDALAGALGTKAERHGNTIRLIARVGA